MKNLIVTSILILVLGTIMTATTMNLSSITNQLPQDISGWKKTTGTVYTPKNLFEYIDGGAELYISYNFKEMFAQKYEKEGESEITLDIFDMENSYNAFGVFSHSREAIDHFISPDVESEYSGGLLTFWKGRYYISIMAYPETPERKAMVQALGRQVAGFIKEKSELPPIISKLPDKYLIKNSIRYFHHYIWLNSHFYISDENILLIDNDSDAVLAKYKEKNDSESYFVLLISYSDPKRAKDAYLSFLGNYLPDAKDGLKQLEDGRWTGCNVRDRVVFVVLNADTAAKVKDVLNSN